MKYIYAIIVFVVSTGSAQSTNRSFTSVDSFDAPEARQGIAVDEHFVYVVGTQQIAKYSKTDHKRILLWQGPEEGPVIHLDSGVIHNGKLYCSHSNYPAVPMTSSVEVWDAATLEHIESHSFGIYRGSCTWIDRFDGYWWAAFAHYNKLKEQTGKGSEWTTVVKFDDQWRELQSWVFPQTVYERFGRMSNSGGSWGPDSLLYCTGHDHPETYAMRLPQKGSLLELVAIVPLEIYGQGIAWDRAQTDTIYGIRKKNRKVVISKFKTTAE